MKTDQRLEKARQIWNEEAATFDNEPDHGLNDPNIRATWTALLHNICPHRRYPS